MIVTAIGALGMSLSFRIRAGCRFAVLLLILAAVRPVVAAEEVKLRTVPDQVSLQPGAVQQTILLIAQVTPGSGVVAAGPPRWLERPDLKLSLKPAYTATKDGDIAWTMEIVPTEGTPKESTVVFWLDYRVVKDAGDRFSLAATSLKVTYAPLSIAQAVVKPKLQYAFDSLEPKKPAPAVLTVENAGVETLRLEDIVILRAEQLPAAPEAGSGATSKTEAKSKNEPITLYWKKPVDIAGRNTLSIPITLTAEERIRPGPAPMFMQLTFSRGAGADKRSEIVMVSEPVTFGIPGLSDVTTALQVPSLLLLPGVLIVFTFGLAWKLSGPLWKGGPTEFPLSPRSPEFYLFSIPLSMVTAVIYAWLIGQEFDFLRRVSVVDIWWIWFGSILVALFLYLVAFFVIKFVQERQANKAETARRQNNPLPEDTARSLLDKLAAHGQSLIAPSFAHGDPANRQLMFKLSFGDAPAGSSWIIPKIVVVSNNAARQDAIDNALDGSAKGLVALLAADDTVKWAAGLVQSPTLVADTALGSPTGDQGLAERS